MNSIRELKSSFDECLVDIDIINHSMHVHILQCYYE